MGILILNADYPRFLDWLYGRQPDLKTANYASQMAARNGSLFGVADLAAMAKDTHKFESRYLDRLVAPWPEGEAVYRERSPIHHVEDLHGDGAGSGAESWMHVEIDRTDDDEAAEITEGVQRVLRDVRESVEDWEKMHAQVLAVVGELAADPPPLSPGELAQGRDFLTWLADDHFTFLGYREYLLETVEGAPDECGLRAVPGTGLGILRHDQDLSTSFAKLPPLVKAKSPV